jgi:hypothetical protein
MRSLLVACAVAVAPFSIALAQTQALPSCEAPEYRALDFWVGEWDAFRADTNALAGRSSIRREDAGCVITEQWRSAAAPYSGRSLNIYDRASGRWEQYWVDSTGRRTHFIGGPIERGMQMTTAAPVPMAGGPPQFSRVTLTVQDDGGVLQRGEASADGVAWSTTYLLIYRRRAD